MLAIVVAMSARTASGQVTRTEVAPPPDPALVYRRDCGACHGADGRGSTRGPSLVSAGRASVDYWVSTGRMPLAGDAVRDERTRALTPGPGVQTFDPHAVPHRRRPAYPPSVVRSLADYVVDLTGSGGPDTPSVDLAHASVGEGGALFRLQCAACHAWAGDGGALLHREAPALHSATPTQIAEALRIGPGAMPVFGEAALSDRQLASVVAYVRYLDHPDDHGGWAAWHIGPVAEGGVAWLLAMAAMVLAVRWMGEST